MFIDLYIGEMAVYVFEKKNFIDYQKMNAIGEGGWVSFDYGGCFLLWEERV